MKQGTIVSSMGNSFSMLLTCDFRFTYSAWRRHIPFLVGTRFTLFSGFQYFLMSTQDCRFSQLRKYCLRCGSGDLRFFHCCVDHVGGKRETFEYFQISNDTFLGCKLRFLCLFEFLHVDSRFAIVKCTYVDVPLISKL